MSGLCNGKFGFTILLMSKMLQIFCFFFICPKIWTMDKGADERAPKREDCKLISAYVSGGFKGKAGGGRSSIDWMDLKTGENFAR